MNIKIGGNRMENVTIPLLWGKKAVIQHPDRKVSIIDLSGNAAKVELLKDEPAAGIKYRPIDGGYEIQSDEPGYVYYPQEKRLDSLAGKLPSCTFYEDGLQIGGASFRGNTIIGSSIGIVVGEDGGLGIGASMPPGLAKLEV